MRRRMGQAVECRRGTEVMLSQVSTGQQSQWLPVAAFGELVSLTRKPLNGGGKSARFFIDKFLV